MSSVLLNQKIMTNGNKNGFQKESRKNDIALQCLQLLASRCTNAQLIKNYSSGKDNRCATSAVCHFYYFKYFSAL